MSVYVFLGPTLPVSEAAAELEAVYLPPVAQGDVYRIARLNPRAIGIVDGYFQRMPAVWHKEILWAMAAGIHVFGSASMGALRAAELDSMGMEGVGAVYEGYRDGVLTDDDEVAVMHAPADAGYAVRSEAMVNIRATVAAAEAAGVLGAPTRSALERIAKALFYPDRTFPLILRRAAEEGAPETELAAFSAWLPAGRVDQKRADAIAMLRRMRMHMASDPGPKQVAFRLEQTLQWQRVRHSAGSASYGTEGRAGAVRLRPLLDELGLAGEAYRQAHQATMLRYFALREAEFSGYEAGADEIEAMRAHFLQQRGLLEQGALGRWLQENDLTEERFAALLRQEVLRSRLAATAEVEIAGQLPDHLRLVDAYRGLVARAQQKQRALEESGLQHADLDALGMTAESLYQWYFARLHRPLPNDIDAYAHDHGFEGVDTFVQALLREHCYVHLVERSAPPLSPFAALARNLLAGLRNEDDPEGAERGAP